MQVHSNLSQRNPCWNKKRNVLLDYYFLITSIAATSLELLLFCYKHKNIPKMAQLDSDSRQQEKKKFKLACNQKPIKFISLCFL